MAYYFFINQNATLPTLKMELIQDGRTDFHKFYLAIQNTDEVLFSMTNIETGIKKIAKAKAEVVRDLLSDCEEKYILQYSWKTRDTNEKGLFKGQFMIHFNDTIVADGYKFDAGDLIIPIQEDLIIEIR